MSKEVEKLAEKLLSLGMDDEYFHSLFKAKELYNNRKELNLYTLDDIEIDKEKIFKLLTMYAEEKYTTDSNISFLSLPETKFKDLAKAIAKEKPIKVKDVKTIKKHWG